MSFRKLAIAAALVASAVVEAAIISPTGTGIRGSSVALAFEGTAHTSVGSERPPRYSNRTTTSPQLTADASNITISALTPAGPLLGAAASDLPVVLNGTLAAAGCVTTVTAPPDPCPTDATVHVYPATSTAYVAVECGSCTAVEVVTEPMVRCAVPTGQVVVTEVNPTTTFSPACFASAVAFF
ncbi:hypothetical protein S7711_01933 [Stachybotrys chartarum IBT 7711]|uniref:Uncharacterized protein n=1 Tax=Stachybotrys chartarum (strain CBS 109288 / IBT 7711) TaxID=1280523 RepID=A0A084AMW0_STACB|nr:hypothetical protein S7711_01933 [Stachybotrys chartarum IBT 7711]